MAVSNTIGSNVFDILVGLGIPWGLQTMVVNYGSTVSSSHFLSEMTLDTCFTGSERGVGPAAKSFRGGTAPVSSAGWQPLCTKASRAAWGCLQEAAHVCLELTGVPAVNTHLRLLEEGKGRPKGSGLPGQLGP